jgi:hypothetical protein
MSYIGSGPLYGNYPSETIAGTGATSYTLSHAPVSTGGIIVSLDGVKQNSANGAYAITGTTLDFGTAVGASITIEVVYLGMQANSVVIDQTLGAADTNQAAIIRTNFNDIDTSLSIATTENGVSAGPITISGSAVVTVLGNWSIV